MQPTNPTLRNKPFRRTTKSIVLKVILIIVGLIFIISCASLASYDLFTPKISGDFTAKTCSGDANAPSTGAANQNLCSGTFITLDSKVSFDESSVVVPGLPSTNEGKIFPAYAVASNEDSLSNSSQLYVGQGGILKAVLLDAIGFFIGVALVTLSVIFWIKPIRPQSK